MNDHTPEALFRGLTVTTYSVTFKTLDISRTSRITNFSQHGDGKNLGALTNTDLKEQNKVRVKLWAEFTGWKLLGINGQPHFQILKLRCKCAK